MNADARTSHLDNVAEAAAEFETARLALLEALASARAVGISLRDIADVANMSHEKVRQLTTEGS